jgi:hypothetical protein
MPAVSLTNLQQQIAQREQELQALREQLASQQSHLAELTRRKEQLQSELRQVEEEITALATTEARPIEQAAPTAPTVPPSPASTTRAEDQSRLGDLIVTLLGESTNPLTGRQLLAEAQRRGYQSKSRDPLKAIENRLQVLKCQGIVRRAADQYGFLLASSANGAKKPKSTTRQLAPTGSQKPPVKPAKPEPAAKKRGGKGSSSTGGAKPAPPSHRGGQLPLRVVLTDLLKKSRKPLSGSELAERALKAGYQTKSAKFVDAVWSLLGQMTNVEHLPQQGYRLKKS